MDMKAELIFKARLTKLQAELFGMAAANQIRASRGEALAHPEENFIGVQQDLQKMLDELQGA